MSHKRARRRPRRPRAGPRWERNSREHALRRLRERYGLALDLETYEALCAAVRLTVAGYGGSPLGGRCIYQRDRWITWHLLRVDGHTVLAVYDPRPQRIVTFLELRPALASIGLRLEDVA